MNFVFVADYFSDEILGGGELNNEEFVSLLSTLSTVKKIKSRDLTEEYLEKNNKKNYIISNFMHLSEEIKKRLTKMRYVIYEHDHKYLKSRNPALYEDYIAPKEEIVNYNFYKSAIAIFCQSKFHSEIVKKNLGLDNIINLGGNLWSDESLALMKKNCQKQKARKYSIMHSNIEHKNTRDAVVYCEYNKIQYELIPPSPYNKFLDNLSNNFKLIFLPKTPETLSRIVVEARMMNMGVVTNSRVGASSEPWFKKKGEELIDIMTNKKAEILKKVAGAFQ